MTTAYQRIDPKKLRSAAPEGEAALTQAAALTVRWLVIPLSIVLCIAQAVLSLLANNIRGLQVTSTLIPVVAFAVLFVLVLAVNPLLRLLSPAIGWLLRPFNRAELMCLFTAMMVTAGISTFGLTEQLIPLVATPNNPEWNTPQRGWDQQLIPNLNRALYLQDPDTIRTFREGVQQDAAGRAIVVPTDDAGWGAHIAHYRSVFGGIPWAAWISPLSYWLILIAATYGLFYCLTYVVLGYWAQREKLIFPLAQLPLSLLPSENNVIGRIPAIFRTPGFWMGFAISFLLLSWNASVSAKFFTGPGIAQIPLGMTRGEFTNIVAGTVFAGLGGGTDYATMFLIIFTAVGISFLLPLEISFSVWFYFVVGRLILLSSVWMGFGQNERDFPTDWLWINNPITAQGAGGFLLFSTISLYRCIKDYVILARGRTAVDRLRLGLPVIGLALCIAILAFWLQWNRIPFLWALAIVLMLTLVTVGLMRIVAEGGIYWFQSHTSFFHVYKMLGLGKYLSPSLLGPLLPIYSVLFLDIKTFLGPNMLNAAEMQRVVGGGRAKFHINIVTCIIVSVVVSLGFAIFLAHLRGAQAMQDWFYSTGPVYLMTTAYSATTDLPRFDVWTTVWYGVGAAWVALSVWLRTTLFWFPHPVGYIMLINPLMSQLWFSFFIGWVCKKLVVRFGGKSTFDKVRVIFIGLIIGELLAIFIWGMLSLIYGWTIINVTLNRY